MIDALSKQIAAIEDGLRLRQWPGHASAVITTLITTIREQDKEITRLDQQRANRTTLRWGHHTLIMNLRADEMIAARGEADAKLRALRYKREQLLDEIASHMRESLPEPSA